MRGVEVSNPRAGRSERVHYELTEEMKYKGRDGLKEFKIPAWMLSEGTRRLTAIFALLVHKPAPSLVCIEEVENGLDPWAVHTLLRYLRDASERGVQILVTTHSPWVLDEVKLEDVILVRRKDGNSVYEPFAKVPAVMAFAETIPPGTRYTNLEDTEEVP
jgi:predicted ATPase